jgi:hypothetical protein
MAKIIKLKRRNQMKEKKTITQTVIDYLIENNTGRFIIKDLMKVFPQISKNTISTLVSRDLPHKGLVKKTDARRGMSVVYQFIAPQATQGKLLDDENLQSKDVSDSYDSYVRIGKAIEELLQEKNQTIKGLENQLKSSKRMILDLEATVQERDRHIVEQGKKIHELSEKIRNKSGGSIKLDELQSVLNNV